MLIYYLHNCGGQNSYDTREKTQLILPYREREKSLIPITEKDKNVDSDITVSRDTNKVTRTPVCSILQLSFLL